MSIRNLDFLLRPRSIALIGASDREHSIGASVMRNLLEGGFGGPIFPVHPMHASVAGVRAYREVGAIGKTPDLAVICTPPASVPELVHSLGARGTRAALILTDGVEPGPICAAAKPHLMRILGPNSRGMLIPGLGLNASFAPTPALAGPLAFVSQSGALLAAALDWAAPRRIGFTHALSLGDAADVDAADLLDFLGSESATRAILLYLESVPPGRKFLSAARAAARSKPVIVMKSGRTPAGAEAARRHTGAHPGDDDAFDAAVARAGMLRVDTIAALFEAAETLERLRASRVKSKLTIVTNAGGFGVIAADAIAAGAGELACAPIDLGADATPQRHADTLRSALSDSESTVLLIHAPSGIADDEAVAQACKKEASDSGRVLACWMGGESAQRGARLLRDAGVPVYETPEAAVQAHFHMLRYRRSQEALQETPESVATEFPADESAARALLAQALAAGRERLTDSEGQGLLAAYGVPLAARADSRRLPGARERTLRAAADPTFGMLIRLDGAVGIVPLNAALAVGMLGHREEHPRALAAILSRVSQLLVRHPQIVELQIDLVLANGPGALATAVRARIAPAKGKHHGEHLAIRPYPRELEQPVQLGDRRVLLRPIRPEDAHAYAEFIARTDAPDLEFRFFSRARRVSARDLARYTQIDYDREMAFVAAAGPAGGPAEILGEGRLVAYPDGETAEFALLIRSDAQRRGLGEALLRKLIDYCRAVCMSTMIGQMRAENAAMIALARRCGMEIEMVPDANLAVAHLELRPRPERDRAGV